MYAFGKRSEEQLATCHPTLQTLAHKVMALQLIDFGILEGFRNEEDQNKAFASGASEKKWPDGNHNKNPSIAFDFGIYINGVYQDGKDAGTYYLLIGAFLAVAAEMGIKIRSGADWNGNFLTKDQKFNDLAHIELLEG